MSSNPRGPRFEARISDDPPTVLVGEHLRDGRVALGTRVQLPNGDWKPGDLHLLEAPVQLDLAAWLAPAVEAAWAGTIQHRQSDPLRTAGELYGEGPGAAMRFALETVGQIPPPLLARSMTLLANSMGPEARSRLVERLNETANDAEDSELRRRMADESEAFAYAVAAAALFDALARGVEVGEE